MDQNNAISFLLIDDENFVVISLRTLIAKAFPDAVIYTATDGIEGWNQIDAKHPLVVICDLGMPVMNGFQLLHKVRENENYSDIYFIILTANTDKSERLRALDEGADDYIVKPFSADELMAKLRSATRYVTLQQRLKEENKLLNDLAAALEREFHDMTMLAVKFLQARLPASADMLKKVAEASLWIGKTFGDFDREGLQDLEIAAYLCLVGKIFLPDHLIQLPVMMNGVPNDKLMYQVPVSAREIVSSVGRFKNVGDILYHIFENFDGSGFPKRIQSWQIPLSSRIIRVALDFEETRMRTGMKTREVMAMLSREANRLYDHRIVTLMDQYLATASNESGSSRVTERAIQLQDLKEGMVLSRDIITNSGMKLVGAGGTLRTNVIEKILTLNTSDPIIGNVYIKV
jgi:response regulator RpfG family c-di-GMP phosphodiesterase